MSSLLVYMSKLIVCVRVANVLYMMLSLAIIASASEHCVVNLK